MKFKSLKKLMAVGLGLVIATSLVACKSSEKKADSAKSSKEIVVGLDNTFVPMGFLDDKNELVGFDIDLAKEAFKRMGLEPRFENIDWSTKEQSLENKNVDALWNGYSITEQRKEKVAFSTPYLDNKQIVVSMKKDNIKTFKDLKDKQVGTQAGSASLDAIEANKEFTGLIKGSEPTTYDTFDKALRDLEIGRTNAVVGDEVSLKYYIKQRGADKYQVLDGDLGKEQYGVGFRKDDTKRVEEFNKVLKEMQEDGTFDKIKAKWFN